MKNPWIIPAAALAVGAAGGFISGKNAGSSSTATAAADESARSVRGTTRPGGAADEEARRGSKARSTEEIYRTPGQMSRMQGLLEFYSGLSAAQLEEEARKLESLPMNERMMASFILFGRWAELDPTAAMAFTNTMGFAGGFMRPTVLQSWASVDPENAAQYYMQNPREFAMMGMMGGGRGGQQPASIIAGEWARQDPDGALHWASSLDTGKGQAMTAVVSEVAKTDPAKAAAMAGTMDAADQQGAYESIARQWGSKNFEEAKAWANSLPADQREAALASAIAGLALKSPLLAATEIKGLTGDAADQAVPTLMQSWGRDDPAAAGKWLSENASADAQRRSMNELMPNWVSQDPQGALAYVQSQTGDVYDSAAASYIMNDRTSEPSKLLEIAGDINDNGDKFRSIGMITTRWMQEDSSAATQAIQQLDIPDRMKERLTNGGGGGPWGGGGGPRNRGGRNNR